MCNCVLMRFNVYMFVPLCVRACVYVSTRARCSACASLFPCLFSHVVVLACAFVFLRITYRQR